MNFEEPIQKLIRSSTAKWSERITEHMEWIQDEAADLCESPIEQHFYAAWRVLHMNKSVSYDAWGHLKLIGFNPNERVGIFDSADAFSISDTVSTFDVLKAQHHHNGMRIDFVIQRFDRDYERPFRMTPKVAIECDGHEFHERTKEQAQRDKERDRQLTLDGFTVIRFTGSEIWRDPMKCAEQVDELLDELIARHVKADRNQVIAKPAAKLSVNELKEMAWEAINAKVDAFGAEDPANAFDNDKRINVFREFVHQWIRDNGTHVNALTKEDWIQINQAIEQKFCIKPDFCVKQGAK